jgi:hypothetical protein
MREPEPGSTLARRCAHDRRVPARGRPLLAPARRRWAFGAVERPRLRGGGGTARRAGAVRPLPLGARGARARGPLRDRADACARRQRPGAWRRRRRCGRKPLGRTSSDLRYEVRCWRDGTIPDLDEAVESPQRPTADPDLARRVLDLARHVPALIWGRDELAAGEMWNSNSIIAWLIAASGFPTESIHPPAGGRAPGWHAGLVVARRSEI